MSVLRWSSQGLPHRTAGHWSSPGLCEIVEGCLRAIERFVISGNRFRDTQDKIFSLQRPRDTYSVLRNSRRR
jgi:hypothetical protein